MLYTNSRIKGVWGCMYLRMLALKRKRIKAYFCLFSSNVLLLKFVHTNLCHQVLHVPWHLCLDHLFQGHRDL